MAGNRLSCGSQLEDMQDHPRVSSRASNGKSSTYIRASKGIAVNERGSSRLHSRSISSFHRAGMRPNISHSKDSTGLTKLEPSSFSSSSSSGPSSFLLGPKDPQISLPPDLRSALHCQLVSSDESGSDSDIEVAERMASILPAVKGTAGRNSSGSSSTGGFVVPFKGECMERGAGVGSLPRQRRIQCAGMLNWEDHHASLTSDDRSFRVATGSVFSFDQERRRGIAAIKAPHNSLLSGSSSPDHQCNDDFTASLDVEEKVRPSIERVCNSGIEAGAFGSGQHPQRKGISVDSSQSLGQLIGSTRGSECKRKTGSQGVLGRRLRPMTSQGLGFGESNSTAIGLAHGGGLSRHNLSSLSCSSAADVLPSFTNSSAARAPKQIRHRRIVDTPRLNNAGGAIGGTRTGMSRVASGSSGCVWHMVSHKSSGGPSTELNLRRVDPQPARPVRQEHSGFQPDTRCPRRLLSLDSDPVALNASTAFGSAQSPLSSCRHRGGGPSVSRGRNSIGALSRSSEHFLDSAIAFREELPNRFAGNNSRISSRSSAHSNLFETVGVESGNSSRGRADSLFSSSAMACLPEVQFTQSGLSGPPPSRPPPLPRFGSTLAHSSTSQIALSPPSFSTSSPHIPYGSRSLGFLSSEDQERQDSSSAEPAAYGAFQGFQLHSSGENRARLTVDGLSEILSALEHVERDEELSYEQILMLEATILLGGIVIHDQHRDMRLDVDNMSYEELLALEERMGNVSTGLNEQNIEKCVNKIQYASFEKTVDYVPQDIEVKCSICQEEFQENVELGLLECGHSHHIACIKQWLLQKNQCPICKAAASA